MERYLVTFEFRYNDAPNGNMSGYKEKIITIGVFDDFNDACDAGNKVLMEMEDQFKMHVFPSGTTAKKERFSKDGGCFNTKKTLISNLAYLNTPFSFYAKITTLKHDNLKDTIKSISEAGERYKNYKLSFSE